MSYAEIWLEFYLSYVSRTEIAVQDCNTAAYMADQALELFKLREAKGNFDSE